MFATSRPGSHGHPVDGTCSPSIWPIGNKAGRSNRAIRKVGPDPRIPTLKATLQTPKMRYEILSC